VWRWLQLRPSGLGSALQHNTKKSVTDAGLTGWGAGWQAKFTARLRGGQGEGWTSGPGPRLKICGCRLGVNGRRPGGPTRPPEATDIDLTPPKPQVRSSDARGAAVTPEWDAYSNERRLAPELEPAPEPVREREARRECQIARKLRRGRRSTRRRSTRQARAKAHQPDWGWTRHISGRCWSGHKLPSSKGSGLRNFSASSGASLTDGRQSGRILHGFFDVHASLHRLIGSLLGLFRARAFVRSSRRSCRSPLVAALHVVEAVHSVFHPETCSIMKMMMGNAASPFEHARWRLCMCVQPLVKCYYQWSEKAACCIASIMPRYGGLNTVYFTLLPLLIFGGRASSAAGCRGQSGRGLPRPLSLFLLSFVCVERARLSIALGCYSNSK
jgi:hypothetical protein